MEWRHRRDHAVDVLYRKCSKDKATGLITDGAKIWTHCVWCIWYQLQIKLELAKGFTGLICVWNILKDLLINFSGVWRSLHFGSTEAGNRNSAEPEWREFSSCISSPIPHKREYVCFIRRAEVTLEMSVCVYSQSEGKRGEAVFCLNHNLSFLFAFQLF